MNRRIWRLAAAVGLAFAGQAALADQTPVTAPPVSVRSGNHLNYGRIVIDAGNSIGFQVEHEADHATVRFDPPLTLGAAPAPPRNVRAVSTDGPVIQLVVTDGARIHTTRIRGKVVIDIMDPVKVPPAPRMPDPSLGVPPHPALPRAVPPHPGALSLAQSPELGGRTPPPAVIIESPQPAVPTVPVQMAALPPPVQEAAPDPAPDVQATQPLPPGRDVAPEVPEGPVALLARRVRLPRGTEGSAFMVPFAASTGAAMFQDRDGVLAVFDERRPIDLSALHDDPAFGTASVQLLANGTAIHVPVASGGLVSLTPLPGGWRFAVLPTAPRLRPIAMTPTNGMVSFRADDPGDVVTMADPRTGGTLLIGTQRHPGSAVLTARRTAEFALRPTLQGIVLEAFSDKLALTRTADGFRLAGGPEGLFMSPPESMSAALVDAALLTRRFAFPAMQQDALEQLLSRQIDQAAAAPLLTRGPLNLRAVETMLALGMGAEAQGLLRVAAEQDPREAASADNAALGAIAALLTGRVHEAGALDDHRLDGTDEIALWRALRQAMLDEGSPAAAAVFAATAPLVITYPDAMRNHILPLVVETMVQGGALPPAQSLLDQRPDDPRLAYARALLRQAQGDLSGALALLDALAIGRDAYDRARAAVRAVELRLAMRTITPAQAADALDKLLYVWRGDNRELALRKRVAELRTQGARWADALSILRQAEADFPDQASQVHARLLETFAAMIHDTGSQHLRPIEFVTLVDENADLLNDSGIEDGVDRRLAEDLLALDLPQKARPVLEKLLAHAATDVARGRYGLSLATVHERNGDPAGALAVLDSYRGGPLPAEMTHDRLLLHARAQAQRGDTAGAVALLAPLRTPQAAETRAQILENANDWPAAEKAWSDCVGLAVPPDGPLTDTQGRIVLRLATATARARDDAGLSALRRTYSARIGAGPLADMFRLLAAEPVQTAADIARSGKEANLAAALPASLAALKAEPLPR